MRLDRIWIVAVALVAGCMAPGQRLEPAAIARIERIVVVPMESRPLSVQPDFGPGQAFFGLAGVASGWNEAGKTAARHSMEIQSVLDAARKWQPNVELANELVKQLGDRGYRTRLSPAQLPFPRLQDRTYSITMENWLAPIRDWFGAARSDADYSAVASEPGTLIAEVSVLNYALGADSALTLRLLVRLVSPRDGAILARASSHNLFEPGRGAYVFDGAAQFRKVFAENAGRLCRQALGELGLDPR
jgi:hypothetical protein